MFSKEYIVSEIQGGKFDVLMVYDYSERSQIAYWEGTPDVLTQKLDLFYSQCEGGRYKIILHNEQNKGNAGRADSAKRKVIPVVISSSSSDSVHHSDRDDYREKYFETRLDLMRLQMQRDFEAKQDQSMEGTNALLMNIFSQITKGKTVASGVAAPQVLSSPPLDDNAEILQKLSEWQNADPDFYDALSGLVKLAKENPSLYEMAKNHVVKNEK